MLVTASSAPYEPFKTKAGLYRASLDRILALWRSETRSMRAKTALAVAHPQAARVFAHETPARRTAHQR